MCGGHADRGARTHENACTRVFVRPCCVFEAGACETWIIDRIGRGERREDRRERDRRKGTTERQAPLLRSTMTTVLLLVLLLKMMMEVEKRRRWESFTLSADLQNGPPLSASHLPSHPCHGRQQAASSNHSFSKETNHTSLDMLFSERYNTM
ncbi:uncharacterized protein EI97DRAFT_62835 [Westerdykella ornata]|uniref:Uncharacterized protein n=1 Tax=Westerdykella ornata TaxID=318751 RepID=A0A6A6JH47_WESOR|nr:uncharacterized protein EI97DRAFT_62835 [Westerdykella ornata]KAF2275980.1 hypothetical protein EI97DRAFT_62835 [Westerdykella ornata]